MVFAVSFLLAFPFVLSAKANLTWDQARSRVGDVSDVDYTLAFTFQEKRLNYEGQVIIDFSLKDVSTSLYLDFQGKSLDELEINGHRIASAEVVNARVLLEPAHLSKGKNRVRVGYRNTFNTDGAGLHKAVDAGDGREYIFTHFEPYRANRVFPCFDQPDLKASYTLSVVAPAAWKVVSNAPETVSRQFGELVRHQFEKTKRFSTYLFALTAGPFAVWHDKRARIPSRILTTQSMAPHMDAQQIFKVTRQGLDFFENYFGIPYPFKKYDQIFVPQFNSGAMENVAAVIFSDRYIYRHEPTEAELMKRANTVLHEMAHMWFGNIVTMEWWNDLWLNESFATYMAYLAMSKATHFEDVWDGFARSKGWAYWQDQLPTTHPIETLVPDTQTTLSNFDGITYAKGASVLKQLAFYVGKDAFRKGVSNYLRENSWNNASREDFMNAIAKASGKKLEGWTERWLRSSGVNSIAPRYTLGSDGRIETFYLDQGQGNGDALLRPHRLKIVLFSKREQQMVVTKEVSVAIKGATQRVKALEGLAPPDFVYANYEDHAYAKVFLDRQSIAFAKQHLELLPTRIRTAVWQASWFMVREQQMSPTAYLNLFLAKAGLEQNSKLLASFRYHLDSALNSYLPEPLRVTYMSKVQALVWKAIHEAPEGSDLQKTWFKYLVATAKTDVEQRHLVELADEKHGVPGLEIDQEKRWSIVTRLAVLGYAEAPSLMEREKLRDPSERGKLKAYLAWVSLPDSNIKAKAWKQFIEAKKLPLNYLRAGMSGFFQKDQQALTRPYIKLYFAALSKLLETKEHHFVRAFAGGLFPGVYIDPDVLQQSEKLLQENDDFPYYLKRSLMEANDGLARALSVRRACQTGGCP